MSSPLLEQSVDGATGILLNITGGSELGLFEVNEAAEVVTCAADSNANVIFGAVIDESLGDEVRVTVIATGFGGRQRTPADRGAVGAPVAAGSSEPERERATDAELEIPSFLREDYVSTQADLGTLRPCPLGRPRRRTRRPGPTPRLAGASRFRRR